MKSYFKLLKFWYEWTKDIKIDEMYKWKFTAPRRYDTQIDYWLMPHFNRLSFPTEEMCKEFVEEFEEDILKAKIVL
jgi:hypothetical protein